MLSPEPARREFRTSHPPSALTASWFPPPRSLVPGERGHDAEMVSYRSPGLGPEPHGEAFVIVAVSRIRILVADHSCQVVRATVYGGRGFLTAACPLAT